MSSFAYVWNALIFIFVVFLVFTPVIFFFFSEQEWAEKLGRFWARCWGVTLLSAVGLTIAWLLARLRG